MKRLCLLYILLVICTSVFGYFSVTHETEPLEARVCSLGYYAIVYDGYELTFPPMDTPCPYSSGQSFILRLDGVDYRQGFSGGEYDIDIDDYYEFTIADTAERRIITSWAIPTFEGSIYVRQILQPGDYSIHGSDYSIVKIQYEVDNASSLPHSIGFRTILDPMINGHDEVEFFLAGIYPIENGMFYESDIPTFWTAREVFSGFEFIGFNDVLCDQFGIGSAFCFTDPSEGVKNACYDFENDCWIGESILDGCVTSRWEPFVLETDSILVFKTYYGSPIEFPEYVNHYLTVLSSNVTISDCSIDSVQSFSALLTSDSFEEIDSISVCFSFNESSELILEGGVDTLCIRYSSLIPYDIRSVTCYFLIPPGYSDYSSMIDTLHLWTDCFDSTMAVIDTEIVYLFPHIDGLPPEVEFVDRDIDFLNCAHDFELNITDSDTTANTTDMRISINGVSYGSYTGLFTTDRPVTSIHLDSMTVTWEGDTLRIYEEDRMWPGRVIYCVENLTDIFGCEADIVCDTFYYDYEAPIIESIFPPTEYTLTPGSGVVEVEFYRDYLSGVDTNSIELTINDISYNISSPELTWHEDENSVRFEPSSEYEDTLLVVCLRGVGDMIDECSPNIMPDTCWHYYYNPEGPEEYSVTAHVVHSDDTPYEGLNVIWESTGMETEHGSLITDADGYCTLLASASDVYKIYPLVYFSRPSQSRIWLSHDNPVDTVEFVIFEDSVATEYSCVIFARDCYLERYEFIEFGPVDSSERAVTSASGIGKYFLDSPGTYTFCIYHDHDYFTYRSSPDTFEITVTDTEPSDTVNILIEPYNSITEQNIPDEYDIGIYPNPFNSVCNFDVPMGTLITVYDIYGRLIENIGINRTWSPSQNESGVFLVKFTFDNGEEIRRAIYIK